jgi:ATP-dependent DNA helicase RecG
MTTNALNRLRNIFALEEKTGWRDRAVVGGMAALEDRWRSDALADGVEAGLVREIGARLLRYAEAAEADRQSIAQSILNLLDNPSAASPDAALAAIDQVATSQTERPSRPAALPEAVIAPAGPTPPVTRRREEAVAPPPPSAAEKLDAPVTSLRGVGPARAEQLARLGVETVWDLIWHLPSRYDDFSRLRTIVEMQPGEQVTVAANLWKLENRKLGMNREMVQAVLNDGTGSLRATWWTKWIASKLEIGQSYRFSGKVGLHMGYKTLESPVFEPMESSDIANGPILPVYPLTEGLSSKTLGDLAGQAMQEALSAIGDPVPEEVRRKFGLTNLPNALKQIHQPENPEVLDAARKRLAFDEFFYIQLGVQQRRHLLQRATAPALPSDEAVVARFTDALPFTLTGAQARVLGEVQRDLARTVPMSRLIQGDVGSGKTAVAAGAMFIAAANGAQSALLAPTQILAEQHYRGLSSLLGNLTRPDGTPLRVTLLTGRVTGSEREEVLAGLADGSVDVAVGTTALIQEGVAFHNLAFVVVDEQHRFGVEQRGALRDKSPDDDRQSLVSHMLVMSATPIPRSLALTVYGDLDVSVIDELPPGRTPIVTKRFTPGERERLYAFLRRRVQEGRQAYIIYPLVEESDKLDVGAAVDEHARLQAEIFPDLRLGLLHGRLNGGDKDAVMRAFGEGELDVLVSTSVVEVGIDVPNATVMLIEDAERFGLAQLHQFRGRVGRGSHESHCALVSRADNPSAIERLDALVATTDGFAIAEKDLELRGPGDFLGTRQSGLPDLKMAMLSDTATLALAQQAAQELFAADPELTGYPQLQERVARFWRGHGDVS